jgi:hypothetical protein
MEDEAGQRGLLQVLAFYLFFEASENKVYKRTFAYLFCFDEAQSLENALSVDGGARSCLHLKQ